MNQRLCFATLCCGIFVGLIAGCGLCSHSNVPDDPSPAPISGVSGICKINRGCGVPPAKGTNYAFMPPPPCKGATIMVRVAPAAPECPCPRPPWSTEEDAPRVQVVVHDSPIIATTKSDAMGRFEIRLPPGRYKIEASYEASYPVPHFPDSKEIEVKLGNVTQIELVVVCMPQ